jgi:hypothetical protein
MVNWGVSESFNLKAAEALTQLVIVMEPASEAVHKRFSRCNSGQPRFLGKPWLVEEALQ